MAATTNECIGPDRSRQWKEKEDGWLDARRKARVARRASDFLSSHVLLLFASRAAVGRDMTATTNGVLEQSISSHW